MTRDWGVRGQGNREGEEHWGRERLIRGGKEETYQAGWWAMDRGARRTMDARRAVDIERQIWNAGHYA